MARPSIPILSRARIARAALELIDEQGFESLTARRLARRLGVSDPSLYNRISSRDDLLDEVHALIIDQDMPPLPLDGDWRVALTEFAHLRQELHPGVSSPRAAGCRLGSVSSEAAQDLDDMLARNDQKQLNRVEPHTARCVSFADLRRRDDIGAGGDSPRSERHATRQSRRSRGKALSRF